MNHNYLLKTYRFAFATLATINLVSTPSHAISEVFTNAKIYTAQRTNNKRPEVIRGSFLVKDSVVEGIYPRGVKLPTADKITDLSGRFVMPSFHDNHIHPIDSGAEFNECRLYDVEDLPALRSTLIACVAALPKNKRWLRGSGWSAYGTNYGKPHRRILDEIENRHPIVLTSADGHSYWLNSKGLELAKIGPSTKDPDNGKIGRDPTGEPDGILYEGAMELAEKIIPPRTEAELSRGLLTAQKLMLENGITSFKDAYVTPPFLATYKKARRSGQLLLDEQLSLFIPENSNPKIIQRFLEIKNQNKDLNINTVKIFLDGVLEDKTAALIEPYVGSSDKGPIYWNQKKLNLIVAAADQANFTVHFHSIGDRAVQSALTAIQYAREQNPMGTLKHELAHVQMIHPSDLPRLKNLNVAFVFSPLWATRDSTITDYAEPFLGPSRSQHLYPIGSALRNGGHLQFGSDWAVTSLNPFLGLKTAIVRHIGSPFEKSWLPNERIDLESAILSYIKPGHTLAAGNSADFVVLDTNPYAIHPAYISNIKVLATYKRGIKLFDFSLKERK